MSKNHDESKDLRLIGRICKVDYSNKTLQASKSSIIGIRAWGKIDYLTHYCGWTFIWNNEVKVRNNQYSDKDDKPARKKEVKKKIKEVTNTNSKRKR